MGVWPDSDVVLGLNVFGSWPRKKYLVAAWPLNTSYAVFETKADRGEVRPSSLSPCLHAPKGIVFRR